MMKIHRYENKIEIEKYTLITTRQQKKDIYIHNKQRRR